jgi:hypothetical protein
MGWVIDTRKRRVTWPDYQQIAKRQHRSRPSWKRTVGWLHGEVRTNDLIWTRDNNGNFWLGRVKGEWRYDTSAAAIDTHVVNIRDCEWAAIPLDAVPGSLTTCMGVYRPVKRDGTAMGLYSQKCFNRFTTHKFRYPEKSFSGDVFAFITADACEDAVALYLQSQGYRVLPTTCKKSFRAFEYVLIDKSGKHAAAQVKSGRAELCPSDYAAYEHEVFLFSAAGKYPGRSQRNVDCIEPDELRTFLLHETALPDSLKIWVDLLKQEAEVATQGT